MEMLKVTATHKTEHIRIALAATADSVEAKVLALELAGYWENIKVESFVPSSRTKVAR